MLMLLKDDADVAAEAEGQPSTHHQQGEREGENVCSCLLSLPVPAEEEEEPRTLHKSQWSGCGGVHLSLETIRLPLTTDFINFA